jgi:hypothetical protein
MKRRFFFKDQPAKLLKSTPSRETQSNKRYQFEDTQVFKNFQTFRKLYKFCLATLPPPQNPQMKFLKKLKIPIVFKNYI